MKDLSVTEAAQLLAVTRDYIRWLVMKGKITKAKAIDGRTYLVDHASVKAFDRARKKKANA